MYSTKQIYDLIRQTEMNDWVGGSDPEAVGVACQGILQRYLTIDSSRNVLDFGCGVGRVLLAVLDKRPDVKKLVGVDIMPQVISFCREHIAPSFPNTEFQAIQGKNDHYDQFIAAAGTPLRQSTEQIVAMYRDSFDAAYAFSVFTHVEADDFEHLLKYVGQLLRPGGEFLLTCFLLTPYSRDSIAEKRSLFPFGETAFEADGSIFIGNASDRLGFIAFDIPLVEQMVFDAGLVITHVEHGAWTGSGFSSSLQDIVVCRKPVVRDGAPRHVPTVARPPRA